MYNFEHDWVTFYLALLQCIIYGHDKRVRVFRYEEFELSYEVNDALHQMQVLISIWKVDLFDVNVKHIKGTLSHFDKVLRLRLRQSSCVNENNEMDTILFQSSCMCIFVNTLLEGWMVGFKEVKRCNVIIFFCNTNYALNRQIVYLTYASHFLIYIPFIATVVLHVGVLGKLGFPRLVSTSLSRWVFISTLHTWQ